MAYCVTTLILAYKKAPELTLYDGLVVIYLTTLTLGYTFAITILYVRMREFHYHAYIMVIVQSYLVLCTYLIIAITLPTFGSDAACNHERRASIMLVSVPIHVFRTASFVICAFFISFGTGSIIYHNIFRRETFGVKEYFITKSPTIDRTILTHLGMNSVTFTLCIAHVETLRLYNHPKSDDQSWGFGQVLPLFIMALPAGRTLSLFIQRWRRPRDSQLPQAESSAMLDEYSAIAPPSAASVPAAAGRRYTDAGFTRHCDSEGSEYYSLTSTDEQQEVEMLETDSAGSGSRRESRDEEAG